MKIYEAQLWPENGSISLPLMPLLESALESESPSVAEEATLLTPVARTEAGPLEPIGTGEASQLNSPDVPLPGSSQTTDEASRDLGLIPPTLSVPPSLARSASEPSPMRLPEATAPVSALSDPEVGHVLIVDDNDINLKVCTHIGRDLAYTGPL